MILGLIKWKYFKVQMLTKDYLSTEENEKYGGRIQQFLGPDA